MKRIISGIIVTAFCVLPNCATFIANNPGITDALANYNCRKGYSACTPQIDLIYYGPEIIYVYED